METRTQKKSKQLIMLGGLQTICERPFVRDVVRRQRAYTQTVILYFNKNKHICIMRYIHTSCITCIQSTTACTRRPYDLYLFKFNYTGASFLIYTTHSPFFLQMREIPGEQIHCIYNYTSNTNFGRRIWMLYYLSRIYRLFFIEVAQSAFIFCYVAYCIK